MDDTMNISYVFLFLREFSTTSASTSVVSTDDDTTYLAIHLFALS